MKINNKKLPRHWTYAVSSRTVKAFIKEVQADFRIVEFCGTRRPLQLAKETVLFLGEMNGRVDGNRWCFRLRFWGCLSSDLDGHNQQAQDDVFEAAEATVLRMVNKNVDSTLRPFDHSFTFRLSGGKMNSDFEFKNRDSFGESIDQSNPWWENT